MRLRDFVTADVLVQVFQYDSAHGVWNQFGFDIQGEGIGTKISLSTSITNDGQPSVTLSVIARPQEFSARENVLVYQWINGTSTDWERVLQTPGFAASLPAADQALAIAHIEEHDRYPEYTTVGAGPVDVTAGLRI